MCGIAGFITKKKIKNPESILKEMLELIAHRGKDNRGIYIDKNYNLKKTYGIGHNRLSVIDLSEKGNQPFFYNNYIISFNGEIYNYKELRNELIEHGHNFDSSSDTEVIIKLFETFREKSFKKLNGMFAIIIYDLESQKIYLVRDRMGVKPLVYYRNNESFLFSSELKSFYAFPHFKNNILIRKKMLANYFKFGYVNSFESIIDGVYKVENGSILIYDVNTGKIKKKKYWELNKQNKSKKIISSFSVI